MSLFYTIGWYDKQTLNSAKKGRLTKLGKHPRGKETLMNRDPNYEGGIVFHSIDNIKNYCKTANVKDYSFYIFEFINLKENEIYNLKYFNI